MLETRNLAVSGLYFSKVIDPIWRAIPVEAKEIINEAKSLPVEARAQVADSLLRSLNQTDPGVDQAWAEEAKNRLKEIQNGEVEPISGDEVFKEIQEKFD